MLHLSQLSDCLLHYLRHSSFFKEYFQNAVELRTVDSVMMTLMVITHMTISTCTSDCNPTPVIPTVDLRMLIHAPMLRPRTCWILDWLPDDLIRLQTLLGIYVRWVLPNCRGEAAGHINGGGSVIVRGVQAHIVRCPGSESTTTDCRGCTIINLIDSNDWLSIR